MDHFRSGPHILLIYIFVILIIFLRKVIAEREPEKICYTTDIRNSPRELNKLRNCTLIEGSLMIVAIERFSKEDFEGYSFPELREITDYLIFYNVKGLKRFDKLFPNLTVIRGRRLFLDYALMISEMPDLEVIGLKSLIAIQRGHVFIDRCPRLCYLNRINWDRLTLSPGVNHIKSDINANCEDKCRGCTHCWSNFNCQKFNTTNLVNFAKKGECHPLCLGGCYKNNSVEDCLLCKDISNDGVCVENCPSNKLLSKDHHRCYTKQECSSVGLYVYNNECVSFCPSGYQYSDNITLPDILKRDAYRECKPCSEECPRVCEAIHIYNLADSELYRGCIIVNGSLVIRIPGTVNENELENNLSEIREIRGYLKIFQTPSITSMTILKNLEKIDAEQEEYPYFGLIITENKNLQKLWNWSKTKIIDMNHSSIFMHSNYRLCTSEIKKLVQVAEHNTTFDEIQYNGHEILCEVATLNISIEVITHNTVTLTWKMDKNSAEVKISYTEASKNNSTQQFDQDEDHCKRDLWIVEYVSNKDLRVNQSLISYNITSLKQNTNYALFIKILNKNDEEFAQSEINYFTTKPDIPSAPIVYTQNKSTNSIELAWFSAPYDDDQNEIITFYKVDIFKHSDKQEILDQRNYCIEPFRTIDIAAELLDYDNCCNIVEFEKEEFEFISLVDNKFRCSLDAESNCDDAHYKSMKRRRRRHEISATTNIPEAHKSENFVSSVTIPADGTSAVLSGLKHFTLYVFQFFACNDQGCGPYFLHSDRTAPDTEADRIEKVNVNIKEDRTKSEYLFHVNIVPPKDPNGAVLLFNIYYRRGPENNYIGDLKCLSRNEFEKMNYIFVKAFPYNDYKISARIQSLAGPGKATEWIVLNTINSQQQQNHISSDWFLFLYLLLFMAIAFIIYHGIRRWMAVNNQRLLTVPLPTGVLRCRQNDDVIDDDDEEILMERMQNINIDEYNGINREDENQL